MKWRRLIASPTLRHDILAIWVDGLEGVARDVKSALGQKQTSAPQNGMSALPPIATAKAKFRRHMQWVGDINEQNRDFGNCPLC